MTEVVNDVRINNDGNEQNGLLILYAFPNKESKCSVSKLVNWHMIF